MTRQASAFDPIHDAPPGGGFWRHRRVVRSLRATGAATLAAGLLVAVTAPGMTHALADPTGPSVTIPSASVTQPFALAGEPGLADWILGPAASALSGPAGPTPVGAAIVAAGPTGWLSLTQGPSASSGYAFYNQPVAGAGLTVDFTYADSGGGGLSLFLVDGALPSPAAASAGDGLGYALGRGPAATGTALGIVGVGFDDHGAFSLPDAANPPSGPGSTPGSVVVRGSGNGVQGFPYLAGQTLTGTPGVPAGAAVDDVTEAGGGRPVQVVFGATGLEVSMDFGSGWTPVLGPVTLPALPASGLVKVGFAANSDATLTAGGGQHAIRNVVITQAVASSGAGPTTTLAPTPTTVAPTTVALTTVAPTTVAPTTVAATTVAPTTVAATTAVPTAVAGPVRSTTPSASPLETALPPRVSAASAAARLSSAGHESALHADAPAVAAAQVSGGGQIGVSVVTAPTAPGASVHAAVTLSNTSGSNMIGVLTAVVHPPTGVTLTPGAVLPAGCTVVDAATLSCVVTVAQLPNGGSVYLSIPLTVSASAPQGASLPNGGVILSDSSSPFPFNLTTTGTPTVDTVAPTTPVATTTTVAGVAAVTATTVPGSLAFTGARVATTTSWALLLIGAGVIMVLLSVARRPRRGRPGQPACV